jgi:hypothetical protein
MGSNIPFVGDSQSAYMSVGVGMFKDSSLMGTFTLPPPPPSSNVAPINMISSFTSGSLGSFDPWVVPHPERKLSLMELACHSQWLIFPPFNDLVNIN